MFSHWCLSGTWQTTKYEPISMTLKAGEMQKAVIRGPSCFALQKWYKTRRKGASGEAGFTPVYSFSAVLICISWSRPFHHNTLCQTCVKTFASVRCGLWAGKHFGPGWWRGREIFHGCSWPNIGNCPSFTECTYLFSPLSGPAQSTCL